MFHQRYREIDVTTASPERLIVKLYEGAIRNARQAREHLESGRGAERGRSLSKAIAIVSELSSALDMDRGGEIATNLDALYGFVNERLLEANLRGSTQEIDEALQVLSTLAEAWAQIARGSDAQTATAP